jgi:diguanylate cyclase (GGDEF)-like protein
MNRQQSTAFENGEDVADTTGSAATDREPGPDRRSDSGRAALDRRTADESFWHAYLWIGFGISVLQSLATVLYFWMTPSGPHRPALTLLAAGFGAVCAGFLLATGRVARLQWRPSFAFAWTLASGVVAASVAHVDGRLESPLLLLILLPVFFAALGLRPWQVTAAATAAAAELALVGLTDPDVLVDRGALAVIVALVVSTCLLAVAYAAFRARLVRTEKSAFEEVERLSRTDFLTLCVNQRVFHQSLAEQLDLALAYHRPLSLLVIDVDLFKSFNDANGHAAGDRALALIGTALRRASRAADVVGRIGGDEFAILMPGTRLAAASDVAARLSGSFREGLVPGITISVGAAELDAAEPTAARLFRDADAALYQAKAAGRGGVAELPAPGRSPSRPRTATAPSSRSARPGGRRWKH